MRSTKSTWPRVWAVVAATAVTTFTAWGECNPTEEQRIVPSDGEPNYEKGFGKVLAVDGDVVVVGAPDDWTTSAIVRNRHTPADRVRPR